jgi:hypothetical protein
MGSSEWNEEKSLVMHQLNEYKTNFNTLFKSVEDLKVQVAVLHTKLLFGAGILSFVISVVVAWLSNFFQNTAS